MIVYRCTNCDTNIRSGDLAVHACGNSNIRGFIVIVEKPTDVEFVNVPRKNLKGNEQRGTDSTQ